MPVRPTARESRTQACHGVPRARPPRPPSSARNGWLRRHALASSLGAGLALAGCAVHAVEAVPPPPVEVPAAFPSASEQGAPPPRAVDPAAAWWVELGEPRLDDLVRTALDGNLGVAAGLARVRGARATLRRLDALDRPQLDASLEASRSNTPGRFGGNQQHEVQAGLSASWELDLFDRLESAARAAEHELFATHEDLGALRLALSADVADAYYRAVEERLQLRLLAGQIELDRTLLELTELRFAQGEAAAVDVLQQRSQLAETRALQPPARTRLRAAENALDLLLGSPPDGLDRTALDEAEGFPLIPAAAPVTVPAELLERRPDLRARRARLVAADHRIAAALAERWPRITLTGFASQRDSTQGDGASYGIAGSFLQPLLDGGRRRAAVDEQRAEHEALLAEFGDAFLVAMVEVEDLLYAERRQRERIEVLARREELLTANVAEARYRYANGLTDYLPVLTAVSDLQETQRALIVARRELVSLRVALHRAVGGSLGAAPADPGPGAEVSP